MLLCAGEASGDRLGAALAASLQARGPVEVAGLAGPRMRAGGVRVVSPAESVTAVGVVEAARVVPAAASALVRLAAEVERWRPDVVVTIDSPGLLLRLGRWMRRRGVPVLHWVCPQVWAWRRRRARRIGRSADAVLCLLPFEPALLHPYGIRALFTGHPAADARPAVRTRGPPVFLLAPGSRPAEVARLWPVFREVARRLRERWPTCGLRVLAAPTVPRDLLGGLAAEALDDVGAASRGVTAALVASGTVTVELAARGVPMVVAYAVHPLTWAAGRALVRGVTHLALPNILLGRTVLPEHLQHLDPDAIARDVAALEGEAGRVQARALQAATATLRGPGAVERVSDEVERYLGGAG